MAPQKTSGGSKAARRKSRKRKTAIQARRKKEFTYRGYTLEELQKLPTDEVMAIMPSRVRRSYQRGLNPEQETLVKNLRNSSDETVKTHRREIFILPEFVGKTVAVYNGKEFVTVEIRPEMIGHCFGEFARTRVFSKHSGPGVGATRSSKFLPLK